MNQKDYILFDLDGTLTDPKEGITKSVRHALNHYGIQVDDLDTLTPFIGPPLTDSYKKYYGFSDEQAWEGVLVYREYFSERGWHENKEYPGIKEMLDALKAAGGVLLVATSKPEEFARKILEHFGMAGYFDFIGGADMDETRVRKADVIRYVLEQYGLDTSRETLARCVMVGDREHDVLGARECGMDCVGVLYGYGDRQEMDGCRPAWTADTVDDLKDLLLTL
ncbi:HAD family hydrolase [Enterocloster aldenensis]|uniref:HAD family hydrolase n=1 Tax=Enterocloster aldenensis TaxID=358742 RepID=UPI000E4738C7|nr:HAD family hydrolase [Enterocloster aldenensis]